MKVCLLLSGHMRNSEEVFPYFKSNLLDRYDVDTFISAWDSSTIYVHTPKIYENIKLFKPVAFEIENYEAGFQQIFSDKVKNNEYKLETNANLVSAYSMWYKTMRVNQLKNNHTNNEYDIVIKTRPDIKIENPIELIEPNHNTIYIPKGWDWSEGIGDLMAYGKTNVMDAYCDLTYDFRDITDKLDRINPERILKSHLINCEFEIERPEIDLTLRDINIKSTYWFPN